MLDGEKLQVKYFLLSFLLFICKSSFPSIYLLLQVFRVGLTPPPPSGTSVGPEMDLIRIPECAFDVTFVKHMQPHDNSVRRCRDSVAVHKITDSLIAT